ncbi:MAG: dethiobiotin synthase [Clostridium sp.]|uniref:dethiobiotin synthase n=1 Tax=Clostridium sp. DSM 8431 TaxID=1761781 RepID=UPI0008F3C4C5|nr:dethiobiotin synthase [Clostridium sp. DSM 8431]MCR4944185.1 dethiobiotin synthase [Clostridium sp.]SFU31922.1 dethiobiotin synthetase [Clostridium sp. DSM 8431]
MSKNLFITGTGTDVGKTFISALIIKKLYENGFNAGYFKAAMSGNIRDNKENLIPGDAKFVKEVSGISESLKDMCPYVYENAVSPHLASRIERQPIKMDIIKEKFNKVCEKYDYVTMEGSGGIICPISFDKEKIMLEDIIRELNLSCLIVADAGLGTINDVVLTIEYMKSKGINVKGIIFNHYHEGNVMEEDNLKMCEYLTNLKVIACVKDSDTKINIDADTLASLYE